MALVMAAPLLAAPKADAAVIQLGFILDRSGSIGAGNWNTIVNGLATAVGTYIPINAVDTYEISVVTFSTAATANISNVLVSDQASRDALVLAIQGLAAVYSGGNTNFAAAFSAMQTALAGSLNNPSLSYVNFATDGQQNVGGTGVTERNALIAWGVDNISIEGIGGGVDANDLRNNFCYPGPCDDTAPYNFPAQGFYIGVANAQGYADAIGGKIQTVVDPVPEPITMTLLGLGLLGFGVARRRRD
jgi:hypothetical protein